MKIGIVTDNYLPTLGGTEISIINYSRQLRKMGHEVYIFCPNLGRNNPDPPLENTIRLLEFRFLNIIDHSILIHRGIIGRFKRYDLDILHSQSQSSSPYVADYISRKLRIPHVYTMHTLVPEHARIDKDTLPGMLFWYLHQSVRLRSFKPPKGYLLQDERDALALRVRICWLYMLRLAKVPDLVIFPTKNVLDIYKARGFRSKSRILPSFSDMFEGNSVQRTQSAHKRTRTRIIYVGRLGIEKRPQILIDAVNLLPDYLDWELEIIGDGTQRKKLERLVKKYKLHDRVKFMGGMDQMDIAQRLVDADVFTMTSYRFDTQGIVLLEACGAGLPIVYCDNNLSVGVEPTNSVLTKPHAWGFSEGLAQMIEDKDLRDEFSRESLRIYKKYDSVSLTNKLIQIYKQAITDYRK